MVFGDYTDNLFFTSQDMTKKATKIEEVSPIRDTVKLNASYLLPSGTFGSALVIALSYFLKKYYDAEMPVEVIVALVFVLTASFNSLKYYLEQYKKSE